MSNLKNGLSNQQETKELTTKEVNKRNEHLFIYGGNYLNSFFKRVKLLNDVVLSRNVKEEIHIEKDAKDDLINLRELLKDLNKKANLKGKSGGINNNKLISLLSYYNEKALFDSLVSKSKPYQFTDRSIYKAYKYVIKQVNKKDPISLDSLLLIGQKRHAILKNRIILNGVDLKTDFLNLDSLLKVKTYKDFNRKILLYWYDFDKEKFFNEEMYNFKAFKPTKAEKEKHNLTTIKSVFDFLNIDIDKEMKEYIKNASQFEKAINQLSTI